MTANNQKLNKNEILFRQLNSQLRMLDASVGNNIRCPLCWELFTPNDLQSELSVEHVPPVATARLIKEKPFKTLTCKQCNHKYGSQYHSHLNKFLIYQLHQGGKYDKPIRGTIATPDNKLVPLNSNIVLTPKDLKVVGVPKANAPLSTRNHISVWNKIANSGTTGWSFSVTLNYGCSLPVAWSAYLQVAYLMIYILTGCHYAFTKVGMELRRLIIENTISELGCCIITPPTIGVGGTPWIAEVTEPDNLKCLWIKVAGNIVILPLPNDSKLSCYKAWQSVSEQNNFGLSPRKTHLQLVFQSEQNAAEAQQCIQLSP